MVEKTGAATANEARIERVERVANMLRMEEVMIVGEEGGTKRRFR